MDLASQISGSHPSPSPSREQIAYIANGKLRVCAGHTPEERLIEIQLRIPTKDIISISWDDSNSRLAVTSSQLIEIADLAEAKIRVRIDNGSGGLGRLTSADFVGPDQLLVLWEFGRAKLWNLSTGQVIELGDVKTTCSGKNWQRRPGSGNVALRALATLSRPGAEDLVSLHFPALSKSMSAVKVPSTDARSVAWSPDGRWLAILDAPTASPSVHFYTPGGHYYRSYPPSGEGSDGLGVKALHWSKGAQTVALTRYDGRIVLLNTRTFTAMAIIEHTTTIDQHLLPSKSQALIWHESVSASGERSYSLQAQPFSPPLSRMKPSTEPGELGVVEACFSHDGSYLATRNEQTLSTVWIWDLSTLSAHAIIIQYTNVRRMHWHPTRADTLMLDSGEGIAYTFSTARQDPPTPHTLDIAIPASVSWISTASDEYPIILAANRQIFRLCYPEGRSNVRNGFRQVAARHQLPGETDEPFFISEGDATDDSLFDILSGRKPMHAKTEPSYTERIHLEVENDETESSIRVDDTFVGKKAQMTRQEDVDPLDDSEFF